MHQGSINLVENNQRPSVCGYCHTQIQQDEEAVACRQCGASYHEGCWHHGERCATHGCGGEWYVKTETSVSTPSPPDEASIEIDIISTGPEITPPPSSEPDDEAIPATLTHVEGIQVDLTQDIPHILVTDDDLPELTSIVLDESELVPSPAPVESSPASCAFCHEGIRTTEEAVACKRCDTPYHLDCWNETNRCGMYGCNHTESAPFKPSQPEEQVTSETISVDSVWDNALKKIKDIFDNT